MRGQLIFGRHEVGQSVQDRYIPPLGLLTLSAYARSQLPDCRVQILDANILTDEQVVDLAVGPLVGISSWFSNYNSACHLARLIKEHDPRVFIVMGGPNPGALARRLLKNHNYVDAVVSGDGEKAWVSLLAGCDVSSIPGISYRNNDGRIVSNKPEFDLSLDLIPPVSLSDLHSEFVWRPASNLPGHSFFPISRFRGCFRTERCEYCSIAETGRRISSPQNFWKEISSLHDSHGIDHFFETADVFPVDLADNLADSMPAALRDIRIRCYLHPGMIDRERTEFLKRMNISEVFVGVENLLFFSDSIHFDLTRQKRYESDYSVACLLDEVDILEQSGIDFMPSFVLGLEGETVASLRANIELARQFALRRNVHELSVNAVIPLPGSSVFAECVTDLGIRNAYGDLTGQDLLEVDIIDYIKLSKAYIDNRCQVTHAEISEAIQGLNSKIDARLAHWGM